MLKRVLLAAILCGLAASLLMSGAQYLRVIPLIAEAESFEGGTAHNHGHSHGETAAPAAAPETGHGHATGPDLKRIGLTVTANAATGISFALILTAAALLLRLPITREMGWSGAFWASPPSVWPLPSGCRRNFPACLRRICSSGKSGGGKRPSPPAPAFC